MVCHKKKKKKIKKKTTKKKKIIIITIKNMRRWRKETKKMQTVWRNMKVENLLQSWSTTTAIEKMNRENAKSNHTHMRPTAHPLNEITQIFFWHIRTIMKEIGLQQLMQQTCIDSNKYKRDKQQCKVNGWYIESIINFKPTGMGDVVHWSLLCQWYQ